MKLIAVTQVHILTLMAWFSSESEVTEWAGPNFTYPFSLKSFSDDLNNNLSQSFALVTDNEELVGFGQYYLNLDKCHLARLVIAPSMRGQGLAAKLILLLAEQGIKRMKVKECSLLVWDYNKQAIRAYQKVGFKVTNSAQHPAINNCLYMVKEFN
ncbi:MAG: GNAT family N-acetyltransferase [Psychromonas sp.]